MQTTAATNAVKADRERMAAIVAHPEAKGREELAMHLAMSTDMTVDQVSAALASAPLSAAAVSALWDAALTSRGMTVGANAAVATSASLWDNVLAAKGMV
jgi:hypothetical protein